MTKNDARSIKLTIPNGHVGFSQFVISLIKIKNDSGPAIALEALEKYSQKYRIKESEMSFIKSLVSK